MQSNSHVCRVESVNVTENGILIDAQHLNRPSVTYRNTPLLTNFSGIIAVPKPGQKIIISKDSSGFEYVDGVLSGPNDPVPALNERDFVLQFDPTTKISFKKNDVGDFDVSIEASGDVDVKADGNIRVGENGEKVAKQNHTHNYDDTGDTGDGSATVSSKTTPPPNESGTNTTIK